VALIQRLVQRLGNRAALAGKTDRLAMHLQVAEVLNMDEARHQLAQLGRAQAGADHRAVQVRAQVREANPAVRRCLALVRAAATAHRLVRCAGRRSQGGRGELEGWIQHRQGSEVGAGA